MAIETEFFLRKVTKLSELIIALKELDKSFVTELESIERKLERLSSLVEQDKCLNAGGKFEWVDSILVKSLQEGSWLLIDQINLCSPAVLDRLNGLLEPGGVLSIGERGVDNEGNVVVIEPHKNFRLFLAMDPRYGEISRAMRNRGVEIYILGDHENLEHNNLDLESLLLNAKLAKSSYRQALLKIHRQVVENFETGQKPSVAQLLHAAFLIDQQISRGFSAQQAFESACIDVYLKSRFINHLPTKDYLTSIIKETTSQLRTMSHEETVLDLDSVTWNTDNLQENSQLVVVRQQGSILEAFIKKHQSFSLGSVSNGNPRSTTGFLNQSLQIVDEEFALDIDVTEVLPHLLFNFYQSSSKDDSRLRFLWLSQLLATEDDIKELREKNFELANEVSNFEPGSATASLPWDSSYSPGLAEDDLCERSSRDGNRLTIILYMHAMNMTRGKLLDEMKLAKDDPIISVMQYSNCIYHGKLAANFTKHPLVLNFVTFVTQMDKCIDFILRDASLNLDAAGSVHMKKNLRWRNRFYDLGNTPLINKLNKSKENHNQLDEVTLLLRVHYKWLTKFIGKLFDDVDQSSIGEDCQHAIKLLSAMIEHIDKNLVTPEDPLRQFSKKIKRFLDLPLPCSSQVVANAFPRLRELSAIYCVCRDKGVRKLRQDLQLTILQDPEAIEGRLKLIRWWQEVYSGSDLDESVLAGVSELEKASEDDHVGLKTPVDVAEVLEKVRGSISDREMIRRSGEVQLWPIYEHVFSILANFIQSEACAKLLNGKSDGRISRNLLSTFAKIPTIPINVLAVLNSVLTNIDDDPSEATRLLPELFLRVSKFTQNSSAVKDPAKILHWQGVQDEDFESGIREEEIQINYPVYGPSLVSLVSELILDKSTTGKDSSVLSIAPLGSYRTRIDQLKRVNEILWKNAIAFNAREYRHIWNDFKTLESYLGAYLSAAEKVEALKATSEIVKARNEEAESTPESEYYESLEELKRCAKRLKTAEKSENDVPELGKTWTLLGYVQVCVFGNFGYIDPVHKVGLKLRYVEEDIRDCKNTLYVAEMQARLIGDRLGSENTHPHVRETAVCLENLSAEEAELKTCNAVRPKSSEFVALTRETADFRNSLGSYETVKKHLNKLVNIANTAAVSSKIAQDAIREVEMWQESVKRFSDNMEARFLPGYPDIVLPLLSALAQMKYGMNILVENTKRIDYVAKIGSGESTIESLMFNLVRFPTVGKGQENLLALVDLLPAETTKEMICKNVDRTNKFVSKQEVFRMIKCSLAELRNHVIVNGNLSETLWSRFNSLLQQVVLTWQRQEKEREERQIEKDSLFKNKAITKGDSLTEDQEIALELRKLFPRHHENDFADVESKDKPSLERDASRREDEEDETYGGLITDEDLVNIHKLHSAVVQSFTTSQWLRSNSNLHNVDYIDPLIQRYKTFGLLLDSVQPGLRNSLTSKLYTSLNFLVTVSTAFSHGGENGPENGGRGPKFYDFYKDSNVQETKQCLPILEHIVDKVQSLLNDWPEHPSLKSIAAIVQRIYSFPVTSSVSRFLTGLELLLVKMQEWEQNAHSGVSLSEYSLLLTQQIISWRRLELSGWKDCLNVAQQRSKAQASKWWFFMYGLIEGYLTTKEEVTKEKFVQSLHLFVNTSTLGEYSARLDLLFTFHCHVCHFSSSEKRDELLAILWNVYKYYEQFTENVSGKISAAKAPIEKKLKDFVKIARWNDISYWAVRETVEKTHRTLHKFIREFETKLKESVALCLVVKPTDYKTDSNLGIWDKPESDNYVINPRDYTATMSKIGIEKSSKGALLPKAESLLAKAKKLCSETILMCSYPAMRMGIEQFMQEVMDHSSHLKNLDIDRTQPKPKQKSQAKSILQQKRMALATYFKALTLVGVSYRTGVLTWKNDRDKVLDLASPPLNLPAAFETLKTNKTDKQMLAMWEGCDKYYYKSLVKLDAVNAALTTNHTDLGLQNMERCRGYSTHIMMLAHEQKRTFAESFNYFIALRLQLENLSSMGPNQTVNIPEQRELANAADDLKDLLITLATCLEQVKLYLETCPREAEFGSEPTSQVFSLDSNNVPIINAKKGDSVWENANSIVTQCSQRVSSIRSKFEAIFPTAEVIFQADKDQSKPTRIGTTAHLAFLNESSEAVENIGNLIEELKQLFSEGSGPSGHPMLENISWLEDRIRSNVERFTKLKEVTEEKILLSDSEDVKVVDKCVSELDDVTNILLIAIQKQYKKNVALNEGEPVAADNGNEEDMEESNLEEKQLTKKLVQPLSVDIKELALENVFYKTNKLLTLVRSSDAKTFAACGGFLTGWLPLLEQYLLFVQFYLVEQLAAFRVTCKMLYLQLNVFLDLATNGFCVPKDLDLEEGDADESQEGCDKGGMGLGDGEGEKDVSDRIETEDQLDDARPEGQEREEKEDKDCKEEDAGIDMSEDFDSKLQDLEKKDEEDENEDKDDDDLDKQMGETEKDADKLDEEIWGADEDENEEEQNENEEEKDGGGEEVGDKEMSAKEDQNQKDKDDGEPQEKEKDEEERKEINEMDEPDVNDDQVDPYHGKHQPEPEPEPMDLPDDMNLDDEDAKEDNPDGEENPFDIDAMKDAMPPPETKDEESKEDEKDEEKNEDHDSSDEEGNNPEDKSEALDAKNPDEEENAETDVPESDKPAGNAPEEEGNEKDDEDKEAKQEDKAEPSADTGSKETDAAEQVDKKDGGSRDKVADTAEMEEEMEAAEENSQNENNDKGTGQAQSKEQDQGHSGSSLQQSTPVANKKLDQVEAEKRKNPGTSDENRSLVDKIEPDKKKLKTIHQTEDGADNKESEEPTVEEDEEAEMYQHIKSTEKFDKHAVDAATEEQVKEQASNMENEEVEEEKEEDMEVEMHQDKETEKEDEPSDSKDPEKLAEADKDKEKASKSQERKHAEDGQAEMNVEVDGEAAETTRVQRSDETTFHTNITDFENILPSKIVERKRLEVETMLGQWSQVPPTEEATAAWNCLSNLTDGPARDLSEKLRLVLEPTQASRLKGDYRTGRRINMRKVIPYIASQFRKDKIWMRRTKPSKRDYQIVLALDDSSSMADNHSKELAFESLALISKAMTYLEVGQLCVMSFGETTNVLHPLGESFNEHSGSKLMQQMRFEQKKTMVGQLVDFTVDMFSSQPSSSDNAKLLVVLSDGRGIFSEGVDKVNFAVRRARMADIFLVFIIVDNPINKDSILDIRMPVFQAGKLLSIRSYMDSFPFPFYMILRDINALPAVLSDALRQWFEIVGKIDA